MNKKITPLILLIIAAPVLFFMGCASTNPAIVLWKHGFSKETDNNPISLSNDIVLHENQVTGIATNSKGKKFWFIADLETKKVEVYALIDKNGTDHTEKIVSQLKEKIAQGGEIVKPGTGEPERLMAMLDWTWERQTIMASVTGSRLGFSSANLSEFDPENPKNDTSLTLRNEGLRFGD